MLRMAIRYQFDGLRRGIICLLKQDWPLVYSDYLQLKQKLRRSSLYPRISDALKVINIADECDVPELLPSAVVEFSFRNPVDFSSAEAEQLETLSAANIIRLFIGKQRAVRRFMDHFWPLSAASSCLKQSTCGGRNLALRKLDDYFLQGNSPYAVVERCGMTVLEHSFCLACHADLLDFVNKTEYYVWENIRADFSLPPIPATRRLDDGQVVVIHPSSNLFYPCLKPF
jgi:hypothetical protein